MLKACCGVTLLLSVITNSLECDILAIVLTPSFSHQVVFRPLWRELAKRGHNITLVTTDPMIDGELQNIKQINISYAYEFQRKYNTIDIAMDDERTAYEVGSVFGKVSIHTHNAFLESTEGHNLIHNADNHFDLFIFEAQFEGAIIYAWKFNIPIIGISSMDCALQYHDAVGNLVHPLLNPHTGSAIDNMGLLPFWDRLYSLAFIVGYRLLTIHLGLCEQRQMLKPYFGEAIPPIRDIQNRIDMLFVVTNPIFHPVRAMMPNTITIGNGIQMSDPYPLMAQDIQDFLDSADSGAIYFSLGSNIKGKHMNFTTKKSIVKAFAKMPYKVLWKIEDKFDKLPSNVKTSKWFKSQPDILRHPNIKLFITQGGLQSMQESIHANKPMIGISFFGDQHGNVNRMVQLGYGLKIDKHNITAQSIKEAVYEIMTNPTYTKKAQQYGDILRDTDMSDVDKAVWWTEYVIRHKGAKHFRNPALDMPFWKRNMIDIYFILALFLVVIFKINLFLLKKLLNLFSTVF